MKYIQFNSIQFNSIQFSSIQFNSIQFNSIQFNSVQFSSVQFSSVQFNSIQFKYACFIPPESWEYFHRSSISNVVLFINNDLWWKQPFTNVLDKMSGLFVMLKLVYCLHYLRTNNNKKNSAEITIILNKK